MLDEYLITLSTLGKEMNDLVMQGSLDDLERLIDKRELMIQKLAELPLEQRRLSTEQQKVLKEMDDDMTNILGVLQAQQQKITQDQSQIQKVHHAVSAYQIGETPPAHFFEKES